jgi:hypothetical protein
MGIPKHQPKRMKIGDRSPIALRTRAQATIMQFSLGLRWLPCMKRIRQAG